MFLWSPHDATGRIDRAVVKDETRISKDTLRRTCQRGLQMAAVQNSNETMPGKGEFFHLEDRASDHPFIERVWRCHTDRGDAFLSIAANSFEMVLTRLRGKSFLTLRGPETTATPMDCPAEGQWVGIRFKPGTFMPRFLPGAYGIITM